MSMPKEDKENVKHSELIGGGAMTDMLDELVSGKGKMVIFNVGKEKIVGTLIDVNKRFLTCTVRTEKEGHFFRYSIRLSKVASFAVEE